MGNTFFYNKAKNDADSITWKDILSESFKKHSNSEVMRALVAGTSMNRVDENNMLAKWDKPWIWTKALKIGLLIMAIVFAAYLIPIYTIGVCTEALTLMAICIPPLIMPLVILIFVWELNIPKNVTVFECILWWLIGGLGSLAITLFLRALVRETTGMTNFPVYYAPVFEEPAKLIASVALIIYAKRNRKIYGITGLLIGACVGAGFGAFESVGYAYSNMDSMISTTILRAVFALGGHTVFCAPYTAAIAYNMEDSKLDLHSFCNFEFVLTFACSCFMHYCWNNNFYLTSEVMVYIKCAVIIVLLWIMLLWITRKCLNQVISIGKYTHSSYVEQHSFTGMYAQSLSIVCTGGALRGGTWNADKSSGISIGRDMNNTIILPGDTKGISRSHCKIAYDSGEWKIRDMKSSYGTYINGRRLKAGAAYVLRHNDTIQLAQTGNMFKAIIE